ncbi:hypothetical protein A3L09_10170 [Thermococcus profundus]|uniref:DUF58 domain-containing protein n=1 Tax=Thermococcus profundus TaxID=49899 RepID=A0A2Z2MCL6_THEPR|nr:DUF58 domain-containing protein [Thermococcus profundus]ASJ03596.1 hypothetical protein A3L09_10170 [Thermococcus profundus]
MDREELLLLTSLLLMLEGYLADNVLPAVLAFLLSLYIVSLRRGVVLSVEGSVEVPESMEEGKWHEGKLSLANHGSNAIVTPVIKTGDFELDIPYEVFLPTASTWDASFRIKPLRKGSFHIDSVGFRVVDERGLYEEFFPLFPIKVSVYPSVETIKEAAKVDRNLRLAEFYRTGKLFGGESLEIRDLREYQYGDEFKRIDWKASARLGELIVREFLKEENADVYIFLDNTREMRKGIKRARIDYAAILVVQVAAALIRKYRVGLVIYDELSADIVNPGKGGTQLETIRRRLDLRSEPKESSFRFSFETSLSKKAKAFLGKILPMRKGRKGPKGLFEALSLLKNPSFIILVTDLSNPGDVYRAVSLALKKHRVLILSPNPVLFYSGKLDKDALRRLYQAYKDREELIRRFNVLVPTIDLGPSDYIREIVKVV